MLIVVAAVGAGRHAFEVRSGSYSIAKLRWDRRRFAAGSLSAESSKRRSGERWGLRVRAPVRGACCYVRRGGTVLCALGPRAERARRGVENTVLVARFVVHVPRVSADLAITGIVECDLEVLCGILLARVFEVVLTKASFTALLGLRLAPATLSAGGSLRTRFPHDPLLPQPAYAFRLTESELTRGGFSLIRGRTANGRTADARTSNGRTADARGLGLHREEFCVKPGLSHTTVFGSRRRGLRSTIARSGMDG